MNTLGVLLLKDLRRAWRNPVGWLVFLAIPLVITALIGLVFGPKSSDTGLGRIKFALVDEDNSALTRLLRGAISQGKGGEHLDPVFLGRAEALQQIQDDKLSAMVVIPAGFTRAYLRATNCVSLELVKNPAQSVYPAVLEELLGAVVTALDALKRNLGSELPDWQAVLDGEGDYHQVSGLIVRAGDKLKAARKTLFPPLITYTAETPATGEEAPDLSTEGRPGHGTGATNHDTPARRTVASPSPLPSPQGRGSGEVQLSKSESVSVSPAAGLVSSLSPGERAGVRGNGLRNSEQAPRETGIGVSTSGDARAPAKKTSAAGVASKKAPAFNIFGYLLPGLVSMFLLFLGENAGRDIHRELEQQTLQRFRTLHHQLYHFVASKVVFCLVFLMLGSAVMLGGGGLIFRIDWRNPLAIFLLTASYCMFASGLMTLLPALLGDQRSAQALANVVAMLLGMIGGSTIPAQQLPAFLRDHVSRLLPNYWYTEAVRTVAFNSHPGGWINVTVKMTLVGVVLMLLAAVLLRRGLERGDARMRAVLLIGANDLRIFLRVKASFIWLFVVPLVFIGFMGFAIRGPGQPGKLRPTVQVDNRDTNYLAAVFVEELGSQGMRVLGPTSTEAAPQKIIIPADFTARVLAGEQAKVEFSRKDNNLSGEGAMVELRLVRALIGINSHLLLAGAAGDGKLSETAVREAQRSAPLVRLEARFAGRKPAPSGFSFSLPGNMVMYVMMNLLLFGGISVTRERQHGIVRRLACNPLTRAQVVAGKIFGLILLGGVQVTVFLLAGRFLFGVNLGANLPAVLLTLLVYAWVAASLGVLVGSVIQAEDKVIGLCILGSLLMAALGGCWWPLEIGPPILKTIAHCLPTGWALDALHQLISFGGGLADAGKPLAVLAAFGATANVLAARLFRWG